MSLVRVVVRIGDGPNVVVGVCCEPTARAAKLVVSAAVRAGLRIHKRNSEERRRASPSRPRADWDALNALRTAVRELDRELFLCELERRLSAATEVRVLLGDLPRVNG